MDALTSSFEGFRLSPHQAAAWRWQTSCATCQVSCVLALSGRLDAERLRTALAAAVARHEALRTTFRKPPWMSQPLQVIGETPDLEVARLAAAAEVNGHREHLVEQLLAESRHRGFDLAEGPLVRMKVMTLADDQHLVLLAMPSLAADPWSLTRLISEIGALYDGRQPEEGEPIQYVQYSEWQHSLAEEPEAQEARRFWSAVDAVPPVGLPFAKTAEGGDFAPGSVSLPLAADHPPDRLLAAWQLLLSRLSGQSRMVVARLFDGRKLEELHGGVGLYAKYLPVGIDFAADLTVAELVAEVARASAQCSSLHEHYPGEQSHPYLFDWHQRPVPLILRDGRIDVAASFHCFAPFAARLAAVGSDADLRLDFHYDPRTFSALSMRRLAGWYEALVSAMAASPAARAAEIPLLSAHERHQALHEWGTAATAAPDGTFVHQLVAAWAARQPDAPAVVDAQGQLSYAELEARANRLAHFLIARGIGPDQRVAVLLDRSVDLVVAILGVQKAGGAYLPLDPGQPERRLALILESAEASLVLTKERLAGKAGAVATFCLDRDGAVLAAQPETDPHVRLAPENLAYVIFTSGSTGAPKGVMIPHAAMAHLPAALGGAVGLGNGRLRVSLNAPVSFDASVKQLVQLSRGHTLVVVPEEARADGWALLAFAKEQGIELLDATPAQVRLLLEAGLEDGALAHARLLVGGEAIDAALWRRLLPPQLPEVINVYGPTECTVDATACSLRSVPEGPALGYPIPNVAVYVVDESFALVPAETPGRLLIGGAGLARGYLGRPDLTAERFVPNPFATLPGERLYDTGDNARHLPDGRLDYLGRRDHQVKLRGFRVELGEIEAALAACPGVKEAAVVVHRMETGDDRLVAYWSGQRRQELSRAALSDFLRLRLPEYMLPAAFVELPALPLSRHGKVDRSALPAPSFGAGDEAGFNPPATEVGRMLAAIWSDLLGVVRVGADDDFFALGGHSLLATQLVSRIRRELAIDLPLRALFEAPRLSRLSAAVEEVLRAGSGLALPAITPAPRDGGLPLSFAQQRLWFLDQLQPGSPTYSLPGAVALHGRPDLAALWAALSEIVRRHEVLRTVFGTRDGQPVQHIQPPTPVELPRLDLSGLPEASARSELSRLVTADAHRPFDLSRGPLLRLHLVVLGPDEHVLFVCRHHIVSDAWATTILVGELVALYTAFRQRLASPLPELPVQYADYAVWQRAYFAGETLERAVAFWRQELAGVPPLAGLPLDRPRSAALDSRGGSIPVRLDAQSAGRLAGLARAQVATPFMVLLAAFQALLFRLAGQSDLVVGSPVANRNRLETEGLIGFFVNVLALRGRLAGRQRFADLVGQARAVTLAALAHEDLPFEKLVEELQPERNLAHAPLFQVVLVLNNVPERTLELPGLTLESLPVESGQAKFDLTLALSERGGGLAGSLEYSRELFDPATAQRLAAGFERLAAAAFAAPEADLLSLPLLSPAEHHQVTLGWNDTARVASESACVHTLFERRAAEHPERPAVAFGDQRLTYGALNARANRIARRLRRLGVEIETRVGVSMERSADVVAVLLGILKAGGAYLPLDPSYPEERLAFMIEEGGAKVVVSEAWLDREDLDAENGEDLGLDVPGAALAYVMYTSGSTGKPKGISVPHRALAWFVSTLDEYAAPDSSDRFAQGSTHTFDAATLEMWGALTHGAVLVGIPKEVMIEPEALVARLREEEISVLYLTAALFKQTASRVPDAFKSLRCLLVGGEVVEPGFFRRVLAAGGPARLLHMYGPTETTVFSSWHEVTEAADEVPVSIGRSIAAARHYLLDGDLAPVALGSFGEALIGGDGLARGYLDRPDLTAERFVPDPFAGRPGARMYTTGDRVRFLPDGRMEFGARVDNQVKLRGRRIELDEIAAVLAGHPAVRQAAVVVREDRPGDKRLVSYVVQEDEEGWSSLERDLGEHLRRKLPPYMVPASLVPLASLPLTAVGKLDKAALPAPEHTPSRASVPLRTVSEQTLGRLYEEVLNVSGVGGDGDFFALGGHSLLATQLVSRAREAFAVEIPLRTLFDEPTVAGFARAVERAVGQGESVAPPLRPVPRMPDLPLSFAQRRLWFLDQLEPGPTYNIPLAVRLLGRLDTAALAAALAGIVRRHEVLRTVFSARGEEPFQRILAPTEAALALADLTALPAEVRRTELLRLAAEDAGRPFDLSRGPLLRQCLVRLDGDDHALLLCLHHIAGDGWSIGVMVRDLSALYRGEALPGLPVQYADFAVWQRAWMSEERLQEQLAHWRRELTPTPPPLELPTDRPRPAMLSTAGATRRLVLEQLASGAVESAARRLGATPFMVLLAAFETLLFRLTGQEDFAVGTPVAGRNRLETEGLVGFFVNTLVMRSDAAGDASFAQTCRRVRERFLAAQACQDLPFERLVEELQPDRDLARAPFFQTVFALQNAPRERLSLPGIELEQIAFANPTAKFELTLQLAAEGQRLAGTVEYSTELFDPATVQRLVGALEALTSAAVAEPEQPLSRLPLLPAAQRHQLLAEWNDAPIPEVACVHALFAEQARKTPDAVAVAATDCILTYAELDRAANRLARHLARLGVGPEVAVGLCLERSAELVTAILGVLKAGGAYVPLDPGHPPQRLAALAASAAAQLVISRADLLDRHAAEIAAEPPDPPDDRALPANLAYVMFTSGSTGTPKGVAVPHAGIPRLVRQAGYVDLSADDVFLQLSPAAFDASTFEIWGALLNGARLVIPPPGPLSLDEIAALVVGHRVSTLWLTSGLFHQLADARPDALAGVRQLLAGGDVLSPSHVRRAVAGRRAPRVVVNGYGPTEGTTFTCCRPMDEDTPLGASVAIGRPVAGTAVTVVDRSLRLVPVGAAGELVVAGIGLARGYLGRPDWTAERFVPDPFSAHGGRLYRTGDRARRLADGEVEFLGRLDGQLKLRGFRVEPGEIETVLRSLPGVDDAVVVARGDRRLVAYVVAAPEVAAGLASLLAERLPDYLVPAAFVALERLPLTPNGKVDKGALPPPRWAADALTTGAGAGLSPVEEVLAALFGDLLGAEGVGPETDFFALGGHSLLATRLISRLRDSFAVELPLRAVFEAPTVAELARRVEQAAAERAGVAAPPIVPVPRDRDLPLSFAQERLWLLDRLQPGSAYNMPGALALRGRLDCAALARALAEIVRRHEVLRTAFPDRQGRPVQRIEPPAPLELPQVDLRALSPERRAAELSRLFAAEAQRPFDLARGPLVRALMLRLAPEEHALMLNQHHIVTDAWSGALLARELGALYPAFAAGETRSPLPELPLQYADFAAWQRRFLAGESASAALDFWRQRLAGLPPLLELPTDRPRSPRLSEAGAARPLRLAPGLTASLREVCRQEKVTPFVLLLAAFQAVLSRFSGQPDLIVGSPVAGRNRSETEGLLGFFVNLLVLPARIERTASFRRLVARQWETTLAALAYQDLPFERLVEEVQPERSLTHSPLVQVVFAFHNAPRETLTLPGLVLSPLPLPVETAKFDLTLSLAQDGPGYSGSVAYRSGLFDPATVERLAAAFERLLGSALARPDGRLGDLALLSDGERHQTVFAWNDTELPEPCVEPVHRMVERQAERSPDRPAVVFGRRTLSYGALDEQADRVARRLKGLGVGPEVRVGVSLERGLDVVIALLAVLKAGGAYLPLDPGYPKDRLAFLIEDSGASILLTQQIHSGLFSGCGLPVLSLDREAEPSPATEHGRLAGEVCPDNLAYVMYTSGSTGKPKGVSITHRALSWFVSTLGEYVAPRPSDRFAQGSTHSFDAATLEMWGALAHGACLVGIPKEVMISPPDLAARLRDEGMTVLYLTASLFVQTAGQVPGAFSGLRRLLVGGDVVDPAFFRRALAVGPPERLLHMYGPTETTVFSSWHTATLADAEAGAVPVGRSIAGVRHHLLDGELGPVPPGVFGETYIGGDGLARGYFNRPALTAERFVPNPFSEPPGSRLYKTGDRMRFRPDGLLEFGSRFDSQVKIRGLRIEPGEIEAALRAVPGVSDAVVVVREDVPGDRRLVAYVVAQADTARSLREPLAAQLPDYMIPAAFVALERLPLTINGKVDRKALPAPDPGRSGEQGELLRTPSEELLAAIWAEILRLERVGSEEDFFALGGHSLLATQVASRVREAFAVELPLRSVFEHPTVSGLAREIDRARSEGAGVAAPPVEAVARGAELLPSLAQERLWIVWQLAPDSAAYNMPLAFTLRGPLDGTALAASFGAVAERQEMLRAVFVPGDDGPSLRLLPPSPWPLPVVDLGRLGAPAQQAELRRLGDAEAALPFDLTRGPLTRTALVRLAAEEHALLLTMHHIVSDGWSLRILLSEALQVYEARLEGETARLPELPVQYVDFAAWERRTMDRERTASLLAYWLPRLKDAPPHLEIPADRPRPAVQRFRGAVLEASLAASLSRSLRTLAQREGATLFMVLLAGLDVTLHLWTGQTDLVVGTGVAGRTQAATEPLIGFFVNQLALRTDLTGEPTFRVILRRVREATLDAYLHQELPFDQLVEALGRQRDPSRSPVFQVTLTLQNLPALPTRSWRLAVEPLAFENRTSKLDLLFALRDTGAGLSLAAEYDSDLFEAATVRRQMATFEAVLELAAAEPEATLAQLRSKLAAADRDRRLAEQEELERERARLFGSIRRRAVPASGGEG